MTFLVPARLRSGRSHSRSDHRGRHRSLIALWVAVLVSTSCGRTPTSQPPAGGPAQGSDKTQSAPKPAMTVSVARPSLEQVDLKLQANGNIEAWQEASVGAELPGLRVQTVLVNVGDPVKAGQVLATLAQQTLETEIGQGKAALMQATVAYESAKADANRARTIRNEGALSESQIDQYLTQEQLTRAQMKAAKASFAAAQLRLEKTQVVAPDHGVISARSATVGAVPGAGQELFRLVRKGRMEWRAEVTPAEVGRIKVGQSVSVTAASGLEVEGEVRAIAPTADPQSRNVLVFVDLPRHNELKAGTFARGQFLLGQRQGLTVPAQSIIVRDDRSYVFVVGADNKARQREVEVGRVVGERVELLTGLKAEESVVAQGAGFLSEGDVVKVIQ